METIIINHWAVWACALTNLVLGAIWYSPLLFYKAWQRENKLTDEQVKASSPFKTHGLSFILALVISYNMAFFLADEATGWQWGLTAGFLAGFGWAASIFWVIGFFEQKSWRYLSINGGYIIVYFSLIGLILGAWS